MFSKLCQYPVTPLSSQFYHNAVVHSSTAPWHVCVRIGLFVASLCSKTRQPTWGISKVQRLSRHLISPYVIAITSWCQATPSVSLWQAIAPAEMWATCPFKRCTCFALTAPAKTVRHLPNIVKHLRPGLLPPSHFSLILPPARCCT